MQQVEHFFLHKKVPVLYYLLQNPYFSLMPARAEGGTLLHCKLMYCRLVDVELNRHQPRKNWAHH